jgi:hypothetical protein|tara:strand:- start:111 stop:371 length:261 start_codon:yes stop_codon:yes gene_type:complete
MPLAEFKNQETGEVKEILASPDLSNFSDGDGTWVKLAVPTSFAIGGIRQTPSQKEMMKSGYYKQENSKKGWRSSYSKQKIKKVWGL